MSNRTQPYHARLQSACAVCDSYRRPRVARWDAWRTDAARVLLPQRARARAAAPPAVNCLSGDQLRRLWLSARPGRRHRGARNTHHHERLRPHRPRRVRRRRSHSLIGRSERERIERFERPERLERSERLNDSNDPNDFYMQTILTNTLGLQHPIIQAPMAGGGDTPELVAAVCEAGALGSIGATYLTPQQIVETSAAVRAKTRRPFGINLFVPEPSLPDDIAMGTA